MRPLRAQKSRAREQEASARNSQPASVLLREYRRLEASPLSSSPVAPRFSILRLPPPLPRSPHRGDHPTLNSLRAYASIDNWAQSEPSRLTPAVPEASASDGNNDEGVAEDATRKRSANRKSPGASCRPDPSPCSGEGHVHLRNRPPHLRLGPLVSGPHQAAGYSRA